MAETLNTRPEIEAELMESSAIASWGLILGKYVLLPALLTHVIHRFLWPAYVRGGPDPNSNLPMPPGDFGWPLIGDTVAFLVDGRKWFRSHLAKYGNVFTTHVVFARFVVVCGAENVKKVLHADQDVVTSAVPPSGRIMLGEKCFYTSEQERHHFLTRCMRRNFTEGNLRSFVPEMQTLTRETLNRWCHSGDIMGVLEAKRLIMKLVVQVLMGLPISDKIVEELESHLSIVSENFFCFPYDLPGSGLRKALNSKRKILDVGQSYIDNNDSASFVDMILKATKQKLPGTDEIITRESAENIYIELIFGSNQTTSSTICAILKHLSENPDVVNKVMEEVDREVCDKGELSYDVIKNMAYVNAVLSEVLRIDPPISAGFRRTLKTLEVGGYQIPAGWGIMYCVQDTHEVSPLFKEDRFTFNPGRWIKLNSLLTKDTVEDNSDSDDAVTYADHNANMKAQASSSTKYVPERNLRHEYIPFGKGHRRCIGAQFAKIYLKVFIIELCTICRWKILNPNPKMNTAPCPFPADGMPMKFHKAQD